MANLKHTTGITPRSPKIKIRMLHAQELKEAGKYWKALEKQMTTVPLVCSWDWVSTWIEHFGDIVSYSFCIGFMGEQVVGIALITKEAKRYLPFPVETYRLGTQGEPLRDWVHMVNNNVLARETQYQAFIDALTDTLMERFSWEQFLIDDANTFFSSSLKRALKRYPYTVKECIQPCNIVDLAMLRRTGKTVMEHFSHDTRYQVRRSMKEFEGLEVEYAETLSQAESILYELITLHQEAFRKKGKRGSFSSQRFTAFHKALLRKIFHTGSIILFRARSKRLGTIGCFYLFNDNGTAYGYLAGLTDFSKIEIETINKKRLKPGFVMHALCMQACLERGIDEYNFSVGNEPYKDELASDYKNLVTLKIQKSYKSKLREALFESYIKAEEERRYRLLLKPVYRFYRLFND